MKSRGCLIAAVAVGALAVLAIGIFMWGVGVRNSLVTLDEGVNSSWAQVQSVYQRRADLIPNLVETVRGYAKQEQDVLVKVTEARSKVSQMTVTKEVLDDPQAFAKFQASQDQLSSALSRLLVVSENYPQLSRMRTSSRCRPSSKGRRTGSPWNARGLTRRCRDTTLPSGAFRHP